MRGRVPGWKQLVLAAALLVLAALGSARAEEHGQPVAEERDSQEYAMDSMVVTASRREERIENAPAVVDVITEEDIARLPYRDVTQLLENVAGIVIGNPQGEGSVTPTGFQMRGISSIKRTLILVDGQSWNSGYNSYFYFSYIPVEAIQRIEIVRGPFSSLYGGNAMAGVVHIFTKDGWNGPQFGVSAGVRGGNYGRLQTTETIQAGKDDLASFFASHSHGQVNNYLLNTRDYTEQELKNRTNTMERFHFHAHVKPWNPMDVSLSAGRYMGETGYGEATSGVPGYNRFMQQDRYYMNLRTDIQASDDLQLYAGVDVLNENRNYSGEQLSRYNTLRIGRRTVTVPVYEAGRNDSGFLRIKGHAGGHWSIFSGNTLTLGAEAENVQASPRIRDASDAVITTNAYGASSMDASETNFSLYVQDSWVFWNDQLEVVAGARLDSYEAFGEEISPKGSLIWHYWDQGRVKVSAGKAFRPPDIGERLAPPWTMFPGRVRISNKNLEPESLWSFELSLENEFFDKKLRTRITPFLTRAENFITSVTITPDPLTGTGSLSTDRNVSDVDINGVEADLRYEIHKSVSVFANYQYADTLDNKTGELLNNQPQNLIKAGAIWYDRFFNDSVGLGATVTWHYVDRQKYTGWTSGLADVLPAYNWFDVQASVDFWQRRIRITGDLFNALDNQGNRDRDDTFYAGLNWMLGMELRYEF